MVFKIIHPWKALRSDCLGVKYLAPQNTLLLDIAGSQTSTLSLIFKPKPSSCLSPLLNSMQYLIYLICVSINASFPSQMSPELVRIKGRLAYRQGFITLIEIAHRLLCMDQKAAAAVKESLGLCLKGKEGIGDFTLPNF